MKHLFLLLILAVVSTASAIPEIPKQFQSDNAATVLGLDSLESINEAAVNKAARRLWSKYHPDRFSNTAKTTAAERAMYTDISQKIQAARDTLLKYLELNPNYNPSKDGRAGPSSNRSAGSSGPSGRPYSWDDLFREMGTDGTSPKGADGRSASRSLVTENHFGTSLRGTMFEFMHQYPNVEVAVVPLEGRSPNVNFSVDYLIVLKPAIFPLVEVRVLSKPKPGSSVMLLDTVYATYKRGHDVSNIGGPMSFTDAIVFPDGTYLRPAFLTGVPKQPLHVVNIDKQGRQVLFASQWLFFFNEMGRDGFSTGTAFTMSKREPLAILPATQTPGWKKVQLLPNSSVIRLGYVPSVKTCEGLFK